MPTIEPATAADAPALARVFLRCWRDAYPGVVPDRILEGLDPGDERRRWEELVAAHRVLVARADGDVVGMVRFGPDEENPERGHVFSLYVDPAASGAGLGRALLGRACEELSAGGFGHATLWVFAGNERGLRFYRSAGWAPNGRTRVEPEWEALELQLGIDFAQTHE
jgi:ribosomal protein S18 acetylase RimI-like enzyme